MWILSNDDKPIESRHIYMEIELVTILKTGIRTIDNASTWKTCKRRSMRNTQKKINNNNEQQAGKQYT